VTWVGDGVLLAVGTFTRLPVPPPRRVTRREACLAMTLGPLVGLALALVAAAVLLAARYWQGGGEGEPLLGAVLAVAALAWLTGGLHLDGLADVADGLGSRRPPEQALAVMKRSDVGPLGVVTLVLVLLVQVVALARAAALGAGTESLLLAVVTGRVVMAVACTRGVPAARPDGLGAAMAGSVPPAVSAGLVTVLLGLAVVGARLDGDVRAGTAGLAVVAGLVAGGWLLVRCVRRLGGVSGDVLGAVGEVATASVLVVLAGSADLGPDWAWLPWVVS
jgi:adenosylcobinamide-GDP ribazoletransferase